MADRSGLASVYAVMAVAGTILPFVFLLPWLHGGTASVAGFFTLPFVNGPSSIFSADVLWSATVFIVFAIVEGKRAGVRPIWLAPVMVFVAGLCSALPLFLYLRERALASR